ncbi:hypothetical protein CDAR_102781 [Caerostris darwini]|uniref:Uncharacterized protein n=1 Tax=Caerostris darwini TaxID=1538125 RepID=A0AAV4Q6I2_9ARAC|nr:hypothetical protein CDAR_102781 [Caerostris darwini]
MKRDHGDPNDDCESQCRDARGAFLLSLRRKYTYRIVKNRDRGGYYQLSTNETPVPSFRGSGKQVYRKKGRMIIIMIENNYFRRANDVCFRRWILHELMG